MFKTTFKGYVPSLKLKGAEATIVEGKAIESKGGSIRYTLRGEYEGRPTLPKTVSKHDFENVYGFDAKEAESVIIAGSKDGKPTSKAHSIGAKEKDDFIPAVIVPMEQKIDDKELRDYEILNHADTVGNPSPASVEPPAPSEKPFPQEPSNENFSAEEPEIEYYDHVEFMEDDGFLIISLNRTVTSHFFEGDAGDLLEDVQGNSNWVWTTADQLGGLSEADVLAKGSYNDDGEFEPAENVAYAYTDYQTKDWFQELKEKGIVVFNQFPVEKSEVKEAFGLFGGKDEEEAEPEEPKTQEFTVVLQEGDKLELTDVEETADAKDEDEGADEENEEKASDCDDHFYEAVQAKVTRPVKEDETEDEEESDEEGMSTLTKVGLGVSALAVGAAILGAEDEGELDYWDGENAEWRAEGGGQIDHDSIDTIEDTEVHFRHDNPTTDYEWTSGKDELTEDEEDIVDDEVRWDIGSEPSEGEDSDSIDVDGVGTVNYTKDTDYGDKRFYGLAAEGGKTDASVVWELMQQNFNNPDAVRLYYTTIFGDDPHHLDQSHAGMVEMVAEAVQQNYNDPIFMHYLAKELGFEIQEAEDFQKMTSSEFVPFDQMQEELGQMWDETTAPLANAHNYDYEPSNEPSNANFSAEWTQEDNDKWNEERSRRQKEIEAHEGGTDNLHEYSHIGSYEDYQKEHKAIKSAWVRDRDKGFPHFLGHYEDPVKVGNETWAKQIQELNRYWSDIDSGKYHAQYPITTLSADTVGSPSPSGPSSIPEPAEATGSEPSNEHMNADSNTKNMVIGLTLAGIGLSAYLGKDKINKWFDRFGL